MLPARLEVPFTKEEVRNSLDDLNGDKASGAGWLYSCILAIKLGNHKGGHLEHL